MVGTSNGDEDVDVDDRSEGRAGYSGELYSRSKLGFGGKRSKVVTSVG